MGCIQSVCCSLTFCIERVLTWTCCAVLLVFIMFILVVFTIYGISTGYHYAQKELSILALKQNEVKMDPGLRSAGGRPVVRLLAVNRSEEHKAPQPLLEVYQTKPPDEHLYLVKTEMPIVVLETEKPPIEPKLSSHEREIARKLIGRFRRSKSINTTTDYEDETPLFRYLQKLFNISLNST